MGCEVAYLWRHEVWWGVPGSKSVCYTHLWRICCSLALDVRLGCTPLSPGTYQLGKVDMPDILDQRAFSDIFSFQCVMQLCIVAKSNQNNEAKHSFVFRHMPFPSKLVSTWNYQRFWFTPSLYLPIFQH